MSILNVTVIAKHEIATTVTATGPRGAGVPDGGSAGQYLKKNSSSDNDTVWSSVLASDISDFSSAADARITSQKGQANGVASLGSDGKIPTYQLPAISISSTFVVSSQAAQLALTAQEGDVAVRTDENKSYIHNGGNLGAMADWQELLTPTDSVLSVNGRTGVVTGLAEDSTVLHLTGNETASGNKTFTGDVEIQGALTVGGAVMSDTGMTVTSNGARNALDRPDITGTVGFDFKTGGTYDWAFGMVDANSDTLKYSSRLFGDTLSLLTDGTVKLRQKLSISDTDLAPTVPLHIGIDTGTNTVGELARFDARQGGSSGAYATFRAGGSEMAAIGGYWNGSEERFGIWTGTSHTLQAYIDKNGNMALTGNLSIQGATAGNSLSVKGDFDVEGESKSYRFRTSGAALDFDGAGAPVYFSVYDNGDFTGTQRTYLIMGSGSNYVTAFNYWEWKDSSSNIKFIIDPNSNYARVFGTMRADNGLSVGESAALDGSLLGGIDAPFGTVSGNNAVMRIVSFHGNQQYVSKYGPAEWYISDTNGTSETNVMSAYFDKLDMKSHSIVNVLDPATPQGAATKNYVDTSIANLIGSAPGLLNTLDEIANALNDDPNFSATITTQLAAKANDNAVVHLTGNETIGGSKTFSAATTVQGTLNVNNAGVNTIIATDSSSPASGSGAGLQFGLTQTPTASGQRLGFMLFRANGSNTAGLISFSTQAWTIGSAQGTNLQFVVTPNGSAGRVVAGYFDQDSALYLNGNLMIQNTNVGLGTVSGTKIGTATGQKLGFWNATPVVQQVLATGASKTVDDVITLLQTLGLCRQS